MDSLRQIQATSHQLGVLGGEAERRPVCRSGDCNEIVMRLFFCAVLTCPSLLWFQDRQNQTTKASKASGSGRKGALEEEQFLEQDHGLQRSEQISMYRYSPSRQGGERRYVVSEHSSIRRQRKSSSNSNPRHVPSIRVACQV